MLTNLGVELSKVHSAVEYIVAARERPVPGEIGWTPRVKKVFGLARDEARRLNQYYVGTECLLIGLMREGEGVAAGVLESLGVSLEKVRTETNRIVSQPLEGATAGQVRLPVAIKPTQEQVAIDIAIPVLEETIKVLEEQVKALRDELETLRQARGG